MPPDEPTREQLLAEVQALKLELSRRVPPLARGPHSSSEQTVVTETPGQTTLTTTHAPPTEALFRVPQALARRVVVRRGKAATPEEILGQIEGIKTVIVSGVEAAGYGDKRTDFRSLAELRQILADLEEELDDALGTGGRVRQIRMTAQWDKGL